MSVYAYYMADLNRSRTASHGIINYSIGLLSALARQTEGDEKLVVLGTAGIKAELEELLPDLSRIDWFTTPEYSSARRLLVDNVQSLLWARRAKADLIHFPKGFIPRWNPTDVKTAATIHDDIPLRYAAGDFGVAATSNRARYFSAATRHTLRRADVVLAVSQFTKERLEAISPGHRAPIRVTYEGAHPLVTARGHSWPKDDYLLVFGSRHPHKLTATTVDYVLRYLGATDESLELLVLGSIDEPVDAAIKASGCARRHEGFLESAELVDVVAKARALVWGSSYEGFGLPPLEAGLLGTAVVFRRIPAVNEVMDPTHFPFEDSYTDFSAALDQALAAPEDVLKGFGMTLRDRFSWETVAQLTINAYREAL
ncbi:MAG: glycosyltransferase [Acidimicrobiia bacterium]|nr:glycosyltransferase [Acidimicrobiia bacterium]